MWRFAVTGFRGVGFELALIRDGTLSRSISHAGFVAHRGQDPKKIYKFQLDLFVVVSDG